MRNKIKQLLNKEEGFTLVELLAVLAILAIIVGISVPMIGNVVTKSEKRADNAQIELVLDAARLYEIEEGKKATNVSDLIPKYLEEDSLDTKKIPSTTAIDALKGMKVSEE